MLKINLGAGRQSYEHPGYVSVDKIKSDGIDIVYDLERGLPREEVTGLWFTEAYNPDLSLKYDNKVFKDNTVDEFLCKHFCEHLSNDGFMRLMGEMWDALKPEGVLHIMVPNGEHVRAAHSDPTHKMTFTKWTWEYFTPQSLAAFPYTDKAWTIDEGYPKVNGSEGDWWEIECILRPVK